MICLCLVWLWNLQVTAWSHLKSGIFGTRTVHPDIELERPQQDGDTREAATKTKRQAALALLVELYNLSPERLIKALYHGIDVHARTQRVAVIGKPSPASDVLTTTGFSTTSLYRNVRRYLSSLTMTSHTSEQPFVHRTISFGLSRPGSPSDARIRRTTTASRRDHDAKYPGRSVLLVQTPRRRIEQELANKFQINDLIFEPGRDPLRIPAWAPEVESTRLWWRLYRSTRDSSLLQFTTDQGTTPARLTFSCPTQGDVTLNLNWSQFLHLQDCRMLVLSSGGGIPLATAAEGWHCRHLKFPEGWYFWVRFPGWHLLAAWWGLLLLGTTWFFRARLGRIYDRLNRLPLKESIDVFERTDAVEPMLCLPLILQGQSKQMSLFRFVWYWLSVPRNENLLRVLRDVRLDATTTVAERQLSKRGLCARLNYAAWTCALTALQEEAQSLRECAIDAPGQDILARLDVCRSLVAKLKHQLHRDKQQALLDAGALAWNEDAECRSPLSPIHPPCSVNRDRSGALDHAAESTSQPRSESCPDDLRAQIIPESSEPAAPCETNRPSRSRTPMAVVNSIRGRHRHLSTPQVPEDDHEMEADSVSASINDDEQGILTSQKIEESYTALDTRLKDLHVKLSETFQHLGLSIQIKDSAVAKRHVRRATALTVVATVYLPATLATGIFGMNIESLGGDLDMKWPIIVFAAMFLPSALILLVLFLRN